MWMCQKSPRRKDTAWRCQQCPRREDIESAVCRCQETAGKGSAEQTLVDMQEASTESQCNPENTNHRGLY